MKQPNLNLPSLTDISFSQYIIGMYSEMYRRSLSFLAKLPSSL